MEKNAGAPANSRFYRALARGWFALNGRKIRMLRAGDLNSEGPVLFAVSHRADYRYATVLATALDRPAVCLLPRRASGGLMARFFARRLGAIFYEGERPIPEATLREAVDVLASGSGLVVFADQSGSGLTTPGASASTAAELVSRVEAHLGRRVTVYPVHLFVPESRSQSREILTYVDAEAVRPECGPKAAPKDPGTPAFSTALESRFRENAFQIRPADMGYFLSDLEMVLRAGLQEDWATRPDWKQDAEGFVLSRLVTHSLQQINYSDPGRLVGLRQSLEDYRRLHRECALRELEVKGGDSVLGSGWGRIALSFETILGFPVALYGLLNHLLILLALFLAGSFRRDNPRVPSAEWIVRSAVAIGFYALQIFAVAHWWGRAAAGYYAPTLPFSGLYLWRYVGLVRPQARLLFISNTIPRLTRKIHRLRHQVLDELDQMLEDGQSSVNSNQ